MNSSQNQDNFISALKTHKGIFYKVANTYCKNISDRDDLIQEITIQIWKSWDKYDNKHKLSTWLYKIALNVAISFYRKTYRRHLLSIDVQESKHNNDLIIDNDTNENISQLYQFINQFNELDKALVLLYLDEFSYIDIALTLGISKTNVATKISRIKKQLKNKFKEL